MIGDAVADVLDGEIVRQSARTDQLDAIVEHHDPPRRGDEVVAMEQHVDDQFLQGRRRHFQVAFRVESFVALHSPQIAREKRHRSLVQITQAPFDVLAVAVLVAGRIVADERNGLHDECGTMPLRMTAENHESRRD